jgi:N-acyl-L-homoserine lactone synthetase
LPVAEAGLERDQFDRSDTLYALARDAHGRICGCARLLPTTQPYLLGSVFPFLMDAQQPPCEAEVWELSRYTTEVVHDDAASAEAAHERFRRLLQAVVQAALEKGARRLITFSYVGVERIARRFGLHVHRAGALHVIDGKPVLAFWIELDAQTLQALDLAVPGVALH